MKIRRFSNSFITLCIVQFLVYSIIILGICLVFNKIVTIKLDNSFPEIDDIIYYEDYLVNDKYASIPLKKLPNCDFAVYDENGELKYTTDENIEMFLDANDLYLISDYYDNTYYQVLSGKDKNGDVYYKIYQNTYDLEMESEVIVGYARLDDDLKVIEGNLFEDNVKLTENQINLIKGSYKNDRSIEKYEFQNNDGDKRTLIFISPNITAATYDLAVSTSQRIWLIAIPIIVILIFLESFFFNRRLKKSLNILNDAIASYKSGSKLDIDDYNLPKEFREVTDSFDKLMLRLKKAEMEKLEIFQDKQRMIVDVSHDLKTPLTVIQGYSKAFLDDMVPNENKELYMKYIYNKSVIAVELIDSLFEYAQMEHPEYKLNFKELDICELSKEYLAEKYNEIEIKGMELDVDIPDKKIITNVDLRLIRRVYENLINNSLKYNKKGTKISFKMWENNKYIFIDIGDNGVGVAKGMHEKIFDPFVTSNKARTSGKGTGLGMAIVRRIIELHGGKITCAVKPKRGLKTEFNIILEKKY